MGGTLGIAIRKKDGTVYAADRWTNTLPHWLNYAEIYEGEETVDAYIKAGEEHCPLNEKISPAEYGIVLIDCQRKKIFSRQDYCGIMSRSCVFLSAKDAENLLDIMKRGWMTRYSCSPRRNFDSDTRQEDYDLTAPEDIEKFRLWLEDGAKNWEGPDSGIGVKKFDLGMMNVEWKVPGWEVTDRDFDSPADDRSCSSRAWQIWPEVLAYLKANEWDHPAMTAEEVDERFNPEDEEDEEEEEPAQVQ